MTKKAVRKGKGTKGKSTARQGGREMNQSNGIERADLKPGTAENLKKKKRPVRSIERHTDLEFRREFREVFKGLVEKAKQGGTAQTRLLLEMGKIGEGKSGKQRKGASLSAMLLSELKRRQDEREAAAEKTKGDETVQKDANG